MRKSLKVATTVATVGALALGSAAPAQAGPEHWPYISANNGDGQVPCSGVAVCAFGSV